MESKIFEEFELVSPKDEIKHFIKDNENTIEILNAIKPQLHKHFPNTKFSLEISNNLSWTTETKLLLNIHVKEEMFFNGMLNHFNEIYKDIEPLIENILCPIVLFPNLQNKNYDKLNSSSAINLIARTAYFNNDYDDSIEKEILIRDIPREQQKKEIIEYCNLNNDIYAPDIEEKLQIDFQDVCDILEELENEGFIKKK